MYLQTETQFGLNLLNTLPAHNESLVFSPISIALLLSLVHTGARGKSKEQIGKVLLNETRDDRFVEYFSYLSRNVRSAKKRNMTAIVYEPLKPHSPSRGMDVKTKEVEVDVDIANRIFLKGPVSFKFSEITREKYEADAQILPHSKEEAIQEINNFVEENTNHKIKELFKDLYWNETNTILVNAIYFKGVWQRPLNRDFSYYNNFTTFDGTEKTMWFMRETSAYRDFSSDEIFDVLHLYYIDDRFKLSIFLPKEKNSLKNALGKIDAKRIQKLLSIKNSTLLSIEIPTFKLETTFNKLPETLKSVGISKIFSDSVDMSGLSDDVKFTDGIHKSMIEIDEGGIVSVDAQEVLMNESIMNPPHPKNFIADHPFLFLITFENHPLFMGTFNE